MKKTVLIRYQWKEREEERWLFWLEKKLISLGFQVTCTPLNQTLSEHIYLEPLLEKIQKEYSIEEKNTHVIPHDPGCLTILRYLEFLSSKNTTEPMLLLAGIPRSKETYSLVPTTTSRELSLYEHLKKIDTKLIVLYSAEKDDTQNVSKKLESSKKTFLK